MATPHTPRPHRTGQHCPPCQPGLARVHTALSQGRPLPLGSWSPGRGRGGSPTPGASTTAPTWAGHAAGSQGHRLQAAWCPRHTLGPGSRSTRHLRTHSGLSTVPTLSQGGSHVVGQWMPGRPWSPLPRLHIPSQTTPLARGRAPRGEEASRGVKIRDEQVQSQSAYRQRHRKEGERQGRPVGGEQRRCIYREGGPGAWLRPRGSRPREDRRGGSSSHGDSRVGPAARSHRQLVSTSIHVSWVGGDIVMSPYGPGYGGWGPGVTQGHQQGRRLMRRAPWVPAPLTFRGLAGKVVPRPRPPDQRVYKAAAHPPPCSGPASAAASEALAPSGPQAVVRASVAPEARLAPHNPQRCPRC